MPDALFIAAPAHAERRQPRLAIVLPCYNEEAVVADSAQRLVALLGDLVRDGVVAEGSFLLFVDDGSLDRTWACLSALHAEHDVVELLRLAGNTGHQAALLAGMHAVRGRVDACITMDVDLQDDPAAIAEFLDRFRAGADVVLGVRDDRRSDTWLKRSTAGAYYRLQRLLGADIVRHHADFRLLSAVALDLLLTHSERNLYLRGTVSALRLPRAQVPCRRLARQAGTTKYTLRRMLGLGLDGITSLSIRPLRLLFVGGLAVTLLALLAAAWIIVSALMGAPLIRGWASILVVVLFLGGVQIMGLGVLGEYIGKAYLETKRRPLGVVGAHLLARRVPADDAQRRA